MSVSRRHSVSGASRRTEIRGTISSKIRTILSRSGSVIVSVSGLVGLKSISYENSLPELRFPVIMGTSISAKQVLAF